MNSYGNGSGARTGNTLMRDALLHEVAPRTRVDESITARSPPLDRAKQVEGLDIVTSVARSRKCVAARFRLLRRDKSSSLGRLPGQHKSCSENGFAPFVPLSRCPAPPSLQCSITVAAWSQRAGAKRGPMTGSEEMRERVPKATAGGACPDHAGGSSGLQGSGCPKRTLAGVPGGR
jgi:hypothetical protein